MYEKKNLHLLLLGIVCFFTFFINNTAVYPDIMECRNLVTAHEIVENDTWLVPTMNGELRLEKPPLPTWIAAAIETVSPDNLVLQRAAAGIAATLLVFFLYLLAVRLTNSHLYGLVSSLVLCTSFNIILMGRTASWDIYCHSFMLGGIYFLYKALQEKGACWRSFIVAGLFMGLSFLGKGPVSFYALLLPFLLSFIVYRFSVKGKILPLLTLIAIVLLISAWWPIYLYTYHRDMAIHVAAKETTAWMERNVRPWYYYWKFFLESGIWASLLVTALAFPYWKKKLKFKNVYVSTFFWIIGILVLLSVLPEKKTRYLLPILIPAALITGQLFTYWIHKLHRASCSKSDKLIFRINAILIAVVSLAVPVAVYILFYSKGVIGTVLFILITLFLLLTASILWYSAVRIRPFSFLWGVVFLFVILETTLMPSVANLFNNQEMRSIRETREIEEIQQLPFYNPSGEEMRIELVYEAGKRIASWDIQQDTLPLANLPIVFLSEKSAEETLPSFILDKVELISIGIFDDNRRPKNTKWHSPKFVHYVTILNKKGEDKSTTTQ